jgi:hypothetical protein
MWWLLACGTALFYLLLVVSSMPPAGDAFPEIVRTLSALGAGFSLGSLRKGA